MVDTLDRARPVCTEALIFIYALKYFWIQTGIFSFFAVAFDSSTINIKYCRLVGRLDRMVGKLGRLLG